MISRELIKKIRRIQIHTSHIVDEMLAGQYHSAFKGRGIEFEEVRPYQVGDDVRAIDWNVTARVGEPFIKSFREERELSVRLLVDLSASQSWGTHYQTKRELVAELAASLAFAAIKNNDKVGLTLFTDRIEEFVPASKGSRHGLRIIRDILHSTPKGRGTDIGAAIEHLIRTSKRRSVVFLISDFQDQGYDKPLRLASRRHDIVPVVIVDPRERTLPNVGLLRLRDEESGAVITMDTASRRVRRQYERQASQLAENRDTLFRKLRLRPISLETGEDFVEPLRNYFRYRRKGSLARNGPAARA